MPISYEYEQMDTSVFVSCIRLLPTVLAGCPEGCNTSAYWGFLALTLLCGSKNPLIGYGIFRLWEIPVLASASTPSYIAIPCTSSAIDDIFLFECREIAMDGWTKGGIDVVCWSVPSFQHTIYPPKSPSLFSLPLLPLIPFSCCCCQYHLKWLVVSLDSFHQFLANCPCLIRVKTESK